MKFTLSIVSTILVAANTVVARPALFSNVFPRDYVIGNMTWTGTVTHGGPNMTFTGPSLQHIEGQIQAMHPPFAWTPSNITYKPDKAVKRGEDKVICNIPGFSGVNFLAIRDGIRYLRGLSGTCTNPPAYHPGKGYCGRISCSYNSAVYYCNDNSVEHGEPCNSFADSVEAILNECLLWEDLPTPSVQGQKFYEDNWNVIVGSGNC
ncbi:hypothetical protein F4779DRAFT_596810 [Xylariaceae sp. FL0662B]|nr:hypothetical protein F4779DRAFT_596810 [Xylariaceae sp. FL0662B]